MAAKKSFVDLQVELAAEAYEAAVLGSVPPVVAVAESLDVSHSTAKRRILRARRLGLLKVRASDAPHPGAARVAAALGIEYAVLVAAINEHAGGDIRLQAKDGA